MQVPPNMSEQEVVGIIKKVARSLAPKYTFAFYGIDDIEQEAFVMGMEAVPPPLKLPEDAPTRSPCEPDPFVPAVKIEIV